MRKFLFLVLALLFFTPSLLVAQRLEPLGGHPSAVQQDSTANVKFFSADILFQRSHEKNESQGIKLQYKKDR